MYHPEPNGPNTLGGPTSTLDQSSGATFTSAPRRGTGCNDDRPYVNTWTPGLQPKEDIYEYTKTGGVLPSPSHGFSASSSPAGSKPTAESRQDSSSDDPVATDLSAASNTTSNVEEEKMCDTDGGGYTQPLSRGYIQPNVTVEQLVKQDVVPGISDPLATLRKIKHPQPRHTEPGKLTGKIEDQGWTFDTVKSVESVLHSDDKIHDDYLGSQTLTKDSLNLTPTQSFSKIQTLLEPTDLEIDMIPEPLEPRAPKYLKISPSPIIPAAPKYLTITPLPPYFRSIYPKREQTYGV